MLADERLDLVAFFVTPGSLLIVVEAKAVFVPLQTRLIPVPIREAETLPSDPFPVSFAVSVAGSDPDALRLARAAISVAKKLLSVLVGNRRQSPLIGLADAFGSRPVHLFRVIFVEVLAERHVGRIHWSRSKGGWHVWSSCGGGSGGCGSGGGRRARSGSGTHSVGAHGRATATNRRAGFSVGVPEGSLGTRLADDGVAGANQESILALGIAQISRFGATASQRLATFTPLARGNVAIDAAMLIGRGRGGRRKRSPDDGWRSGGSCGSGRGGNRTPLNMRRSG